jgi:hypothetical protein
VISEKIKWDDKYALSSSCLKGARTRSKDDDNLCNCCHLLFFKGMTMGRKKRTQKKTRDPPARALASQDK